MRDLLEDYLQSKAFPLKGEGSQEKMFTIHQWKPLEYQINGSEVKVDFSCYDWDDVTHQVTLTLNIWEVLDFTYTTLKSLRIR